MHPPGDFGYGTAPAGAGYVGVDHDQLYNDGSFIYNGDNSAYYNSQHFETLPAKKTIESELGPYCRPVSVQYDSLTASEIARISTIALNSEMLYDKEKVKTEYGPLDLRFGPTERGVICRECNKSILDCPGCPGHFGHVPLALPVFHPGFARHVYGIAQALCKCCGRLLLPETAPVCIEDDDEAAAEDSDGGGDLQAGGALVGHKLAEVELQTAPAGTTTRKRVAASKATTEAERRTKVAKTLGGGETAVGGSASSTGQPPSKPSAPRPNGAGATTTSCNDVGEVSAAEARKMVDDMFAPSARKEGKKSVSRKQFTGQMISATRKGDNQLKSAIVKRVIEACKKIRYCPHCSAWNGNVRKQGGIPLAFKHEKFGNPKLEKDLPPDNFVLADSVLDLATNSASGTGDGGSGGGLNPILQDLLTARKVATKNLKTSQVGRTKTVATKGVGEVMAGMIGAKQMNGAALSSRPLGANGAAAGGGALVAATTSAAHLSGGGSRNLSDETNFNTLAANTTEDITPLLLFQLAQNMTPRDCFLLNIQRPSALFLTAQPVPPGPIRPTVNAGISTNDDDLTHQIGKIYYGDKMIRNDLESGNSGAVHIIDLWRDQQTECARIINSSVAGLPNETRMRMGGEGKKQIRSLATRLKGKEGRFRGNLMGKRVDYSGRTVISPDPNVEIDEVVIPEHVAKKITFTERVTAVNVEKMRKFVSNGGEKHPGANMIESVTNGAKYNIYTMPKNARVKKAQALQIGDIVHRHMQNGDVVLFNRQPSLHRMSIMAHKARIQGARTFRFNECVCGPYNADFDGDEMNIHLPQTWEARAEAYHLMGVKPGVISPRNGEPAIACTQDFLTASFWVTQKDAFFGRAQVAQLVCHATKGLEQVDWPPAAILKPMELWSGKQVFSMLLRPGRKDRNLLINTEITERNYSKKGKNFCRKDGYVEWRNSELISGNLGKKTLGDGAKTGLFAKLVRDTTNDISARMMGRVARFSARFLQNVGFTIGIDDVQPNPVVMGKKAAITATKMASIEQHIRDYANGTILLKPGCSAETTLEALINGDLGAIRQETGDSCNDDLQLTNKVQVMTTCGSKGSAMNLCQMMACLGQQNVSGARIKDGFVNRTLPLFKYNAKEPKARGFVANSFYSGLEASEFFFHTMGGREGLVDTAVKTAETGYMQRRLIKALEDLSVKYDLSVRTSNGRVIQFAYGADGLNPGSMEGKDRPLDLKHTLSQVLRVTRGPEGVKQKELHGGLSDWQRKKLSATQAKAQTPIVFNSMKMNLAGQPGAGQSGATAAAPKPKKKDRHKKNKDQGAQLTGPDQYYLSLNDQEYFAKNDPAISEEQYLYTPLTSAEFAKIAGPILDRAMEWIQSAYPSAFDLDTAAFEFEMKKFLLTDVVERIRNAEEDIERNEAASRGGAALADHADSRDDEDEKLQRKQRRRQQALHNRGACITRHQLDEFLHRCATKYVRALHHPGEAVGVVAAQSIGEPATQMTLKTFHFAGVASMNVTLGVPRIKELMDAVKSISTPVITARLENPKDPTFARLIKTRVEKTVLADVCAHFKEVYLPFSEDQTWQRHLKSIEHLWKEQNSRAGPGAGANNREKMDDSHPDFLLNRVEKPSNYTLHGGGMFLVIKLNTDTLRKLQMDLTPRMVMRAIRAQIPLTKFKYTLVEVSACKIRLYPYGPSGMFDMAALQQLLPAVHVQGQANCARAVINLDDKGNHELLVEGTGLQDVMIETGVVAKSTVSNNVMEVVEVLGIEAARATITSEITKVMGSHGLEVDSRHIQLLGDTMTSMGAVYGMTRHGIQKLKATTMMLASFEKTNDHLFDAAAHRRRDPVVGVSECIILGSPINFGTGLFDLMYEPLNKKSSRSSLYQTSSAVYPTKGGLSLMSRIAGRMGTARPTLPAQTGAPADRDSFGEGAPKPKRMRTGSPQAANA